MSVNVNPGLVRVGRTVASWTSSKFFINKNALTGIKNVQYEQKRTRKPVRSNVAGARPLGRPTGLYSVPTITVRQLREDAEQIATFLQSPFVNVVGKDSYADSTFTFQASVNEHADPLAGVHMLASGCTVDGRKTVYDQGSGALVEEWTISALWIQETDANGTRYLYSTEPNAIDAMGQDWITIQADVSPGRATILDPTREIGWDIRQAFAFDKATLVPKGNPPAKFDILFELWTPEQLDVWTPFAAKYFKRAVVLKDAAAYALAIRHPILQAQPIALQDCVLTKVGGLNRVGEEGMWASKMSFMEYGQPKIAPQKPPSAIAPAGAVVTSVPTQREFVTQQKTDELRALSDPAASQLTGGGFGL